VKRKRWQIGWKLLNRKGLLLTLGLSVWVLASCSLSRRSQYMVDMVKPASTLGWPSADFGSFEEAQHPVLQVAYPAVPDAEYVNYDQLCMTCHESYVKTFAHNVHRAQKCEDCHGPASRHVTTRGKEPGLILNFKQLKKAERSEICLKCHEQNQCEPGAPWRTSSHAHHGVSCTDCHSAHYNLPPGTPKYDPAIAGLPPEAQQVAFVQEDVQAETLPAIDPAIDQAFLRAASNHLGAVTPQICYQCHSSMEQFEKLAHPHQMLGPNKFTCDTCHDPHGNVRQETRTDLCLQCHQDAPTMAWHSSTHSLNGVACTDCHNPHPTTFVQGTVGITHTHISRPKRMPTFRCRPRA
jgi:predicted CXXCH cytochrome family protein